MSEMRTQISLAGDTLVIANQQDVGVILDEVARLRHGSGDSEMQHVGRIPHVVVEQYLIDNGINFEEFCGSQDHIKRILNDPDNKLLRIKEGRV